MTDEPKIIDGTSILIKLSAVEATRARAYRVKLKKKHKDIYMAGIPADFDDGTINTVGPSNETVGTGNA